MFNPTDPPVTTPALAPPTDPSKDESTVSRETLTRRLFRFDMVLVSLTLVLAFFLGSFLATNSDIFLDLALGNPFGADADPTGWPHHAWLPSLVLGSFYEPFSEKAEIGGICAVVAKALIVVALAVLLCLTRRPGQSWLLPVVGTALTVLVMSPRFLLQPMVLSFLFLAVTFWVLNLPAADWPRAIWYLPALFVLWVNCDQWFVLGPLTVALFLLGEWFQRRLKLPSLVDVAAPPERIKQLGLVLLVGLAVCLVNPWTYRALTLPLELAQLASTGNIAPGPLVAGGRMVRQVQDNDPFFIQRLSPLSSDFWSRSSFGQNAAGLAYFVLLLAGIASFVVPGYVFKSTPSDKPSRAPCTWSLAVVFVVFALLSMWTYRLIPLFAVVAGPIAVLNFQDYLRRQAGRDPMVSRKELNWAVGARGGALLAVLILVTCAWAGWLHGNADDWRLSRHVAWGIAEDPGIQDAAASIIHIQQYGREHQQPGLLKLGFNFATDSGNLLAWTNRHGWPGVQVLFDGRYSLCPRDRAEALGKIRKALREEMEGMRKQGPGASRDTQDKRGAARLTYQESLRKVGCDYVVFTNIHRDAGQQAIAQVLQGDPLQWTALYHDGRTAVFGWRDPKKRNDPFAAVQLNLTPLDPQATFPPNTLRVTLKSGVPPTPTGPRTEWDDFLTGPVQPGLSRFEAAACLQHYQTMSQLGQMSFQSLLAEAGGPAAQAGRRSLASFDPLRDPGPPGALLLAMRAARNGVLESPDDFVAHLQLADSCIRTLDLEDRWAGRPPLLADAYKAPSLRVRLRQVVMLTAMHHAVVLQPSDWVIQRSLGSIYERLNFLDLALTHFSQGRDDPKHLQRLSEEVKRRQDEFKAATTGVTDPIEKFKKALAGDREPRGLVKLGLTILQDADPKRLEGPALATLVTWQMYLMLMTGEAEAVSQSKSENLRKNLPPGEYEEMQALAAAALGDYLTADRLLAEAEKAYQLPSDDQIVNLEQQSIQQLLALQTSMAAWLPGEDGIVGPSARLLASVGQQRALFKDLANLAEPRARVADLRLVRGLLILEAGQCGLALKHFQDSLRIGPLVAQIFLPDRAVARRYVESLQGK
jgi:hypothetical protein